MANEMFKKNITEITYKLKRSIRFKWYNHKTSVRVFDFSKES